MMEAFDGYKVISLWLVAAFDGRFWWPLFFFLLIGMLIIVLFVRRQSYGGRTTILRAIIDSFNTPVLFYDEEGRLAFSNDEADEVFRALSSEIGEFGYFEDNAKPDGATKYLEDEHGNGYRLEIISKEYMPGKKGQVVFVKGYARVR
jgi:PAS domain-containing protein